MRNIATQRLYDYFNHVRGNRAAPCRSEINPADMKAYLANVFILGAHDEGRFHFRLAGTRICHHKGRELRGENFAHLFRREAHHRVQLMLQTVVASHTGLLINATDEDGGIETEILCLPLLSANGECDRILGLLCAVGIAPHQRLGRLQTNGMRLLGDRAPLQAPAAEQVARIVSGNGTFLTVHEGGRA